MLNFTSLLLGIVEALRRAVTAYAAEQARAPLVVWLGTQAFIATPAPSRHPPLPSETWVLLTVRLTRLAARLRAIFARWQAGITLPQRPARASQPRTRAPYPRLPATSGWINARIAAAAPCGGNLHFLLHDPSAAQFLAEIPQAGRLLRPLCRMLAITLPAGLRLPPRPPRQQRTTPTPPNPTAPLPTPDRPLQPHLRAAARAWRHRAT